MGVRAGKNFPTRVSILFISTLDLIAAAYRFDPGATTSNENMMSTADESERCLEYKCGSHFKVERTTVRRSLHRMVRCALAIRESVLR